MRSFPTELSIFATLLFLLDSNDWVVHPVVGANQRLYNTLTNKLQVDLKLFVCTLQRASALVQQWSVFCGLKILIRLHEKTTQPYNSIFTKNSPRHYSRYFIYSVSLYLIPSICQAFFQEWGFPFTYAMIPLLKESRKCFRLVLSDCGNSLHVPQFLAF